MEAEVALSSGRNIEKIELKCNEDRDVSNSILAVQMLERVPNILLTGKRIRKV